MKQPHEDVQGSPRADDLLSLDESAVTHRDALIAMARLFSRTCLVGNPAPVVRDIDTRINKPRPGDLVVEQSVMYTRDPAKRLKGLGILIETRDEWAVTDAEHAAEVAYQREEYGEVIDNERLTGTAWYVQYGPHPGDVCRWTDCSFVALPVHEKW